MFNVRKMREQMKSASWHLNAAGGFGISSGVFILSGTALAVIGAATGKPVVSYIGAGVGGLGLVLSIPAFANLKRAGKALRK